MKNTDGRTHLRSLPALLALSLSLQAATAFAQQLGPPGRKPEGGVAFFVEIAVPWSALELGDGRNERFQGRLKIWDGEGPFHAGATDLVLRDGRGEAVPPPAALSFRLNDQGDAFGGGESLKGSELPRELRYRLIATSDFALLPLRLLFPHEMPASRGSTPASRRIAREGFRVRFEERFAGVERISYTPLRSHSGRTVRTFLPSGFELQDFTLTYEDERDDTVMGGFGLRILVHHDRPLEDGRPAPSGVHHLSVLRTHQLDWMRETTVVPVSDWNKKYNEWWERLPDQLFLELSADAAGNPFQSPVAFALRALRLLDEQTLHRLSSQADARTLSALAPHLIELPLSYAPDRFLGAWEASVDPVQRLLLAAAVAETGDRQPRFGIEAEIALHSQDPETLRAALLLARTLRMPELIPALQRIVAGGATEEQKLLALCALGAQPGPDTGDAADAILRCLEHSPSNRLRAAALCALADLGDPSLEPFFNDSQACFGARDPISGQFELLVEDSAKAGELLYRLSKLAAAVRSGTAAEALSAFERALADEGAEPPDGLAWAAAEWSLRTAHLTRELGRLLDNPRQGPLARRLVHASGRASAGSLLSDLDRAQGAELEQLAVLLGATKDPRARAILLALRNSDDEDRSDAGDAGFEALRRED